jgi:hypothetical protein
MNNEDFFEIKYSALHSEMINISHRCELSLKKEGKKRRK